MFVARGEAPGTGEYQITASLVKENKNKNLYVRQWQNGWVI